MIEAGTFKFLTGLKKKNNREWFEANRGAYELARKNFLAFTTEWLEGLKKLDPAIARENPDPKRCLSRIYRDIRFSKDKTPYKDHLFASVQSGGKNSPQAGYYFQMQPGDKSFIGGGSYMPEAANLFKIRQEIDYQFKEWKSITGSKTFLKAFPKGIQSSGVISRPPKNFDAESPAVEYLKRKDFYVFAPVTDAVLQSKTGIKTLMEASKAVKPLLEFLNHAIE